MLKKLTQKFSRNNSKTIPLKKDILIRNYYWYNIYEMAKTVKGSIVECGVGTGTGLCTWSLLSNYNESEKKILAIDSFEGFSEFKKEDGKNVDYNIYKANYSQYNVKYVVEHLIEFGIEQDFIDNYIEFVQGYVPEVLEELSSDLDISILNLDFDLYQPIKDTFLKLYPNVASKGIIMFDEYDKPRDLKKWPGAKLAIDEVFDILKLDKSDIQKDKKSGYSFYIKK